MKSLHTNRYCFAPDLTDDPELITACEQYHTAVWPAILDSMKDAGITAIQIYRTANRLLMIINTIQNFSFEAKTDAANPAVQEWEQRMWKYQQVLPGSKPGEKRIGMKQLFSL